MSFIRFAIFASLSLFSACSALAAPFEIQSSKRIWGEAPHNAFGDIIRFHDQWFCVFRESTVHVTGPGKMADGKLRVIRSKDGDTWQSAALIEEKGIDLRDPHLSVTAGGRLMIVSGGSEYPGGVYHGRQPRIMFSKDGLHWTEPARVLRQGDWLWRVTWFQGKAYGVVKYGSPSKEMPDNPRREDLVTSTDGLHWTVITELKVPGGDESTVRFLQDGRMVILMRRALPDDDLAEIGVGAPPYTNFQWKKTGHYIGGPNFIVLPDGRMIAGGRLFVNGDPKHPKTAIGPLTLEAYTPDLQLPSGGDSSYPGFAFYQGQLWVLYYSSHEEKTAIYLAKVKLD